MKNYICINGNKTELTEEQLRQLGIELPKANPFTFCGKRDEPYFFITSMGSVVEATGHVSRLERYAVANYCTDKAIMEQRALHETLNRLLWRYSMEHDGDKIDWKDKNKAKFYVYYNCDLKEWRVCSVYSSHYFDVFYHTKQAAQNAIEEIIKPFMAQHPEFKF